MEDGIEHMMDATQAKGNKIGNNLVKLSLTGLWFRINDKINRLKQMIIIGAQDNVGETLTDTYQDLSVYGIIAQIVQNKKWGK